MQVRWLTAGLFAALLGGGSLLLGGPDKDKAMTPEKRTTAQEPVASNEPADASTRVMKGTVVDLKGMSLTLRRDTGEFEFFTLDDPGLTLKIDPGVKKGSKVKVTEKVTSGSRWLSVELTAA
jgi:hypothetical protein